MDVGDLIQLKTKEKTYVGRFVPSTDKKVLVLKLENGYNVGIEKSKVTSKKLLEKFKESKAKPKKVAQKGKKTISILHTGGTVASKVSYKTGGVVAKFTPEDILEMFPELKTIAKINTRLIANMFSADMRFAHYNLMAKEVQKEIKKGVDGVIITHGTDTMHYTSAALAFIFENLPIPVILVGAQRSSDRGSSDAAFNLVHAAHFITKGDYKGVAICMHEESGDKSALILPPTKARKMHSSRRDTFRPVNSSPLARVKKDYTVQRLSLPHKEEGKLSAKYFKENVKVGILKSHPNMFAQEIKAYSTFDALVLEGSGLGHIGVDKIDAKTAENVKVLKEIEKLAKKVPVVMTTQCIFGRVDMDVYEYGRKLKAAGVLGNFMDMTAETAFIKLAWLLSNYKKDKVKQLYEQNLRGEISGRSIYKGDFLK